MNINSIRTGWTITKVSYPFPIMTKYLPGIFSWNMTMNFSPIFVTFYKSMVRWNWIRTAEHWYDQREKSPQVIITSKGYNFHNCTCVHFILLVMIWIQTRIHIVFALGYNYVHFTYLPKQMPSFYFQLYYIYCRNILIHVNYLHIRLQNLVCVPPLELNL